MNILFPKVFRTATFAIRRIGQVYQKTMLAACLLLTAVPSIAQHSYKNILIETAGSQTSDAELVAIDRLSAHITSRINVVQAGRKEGGDYDLKLILGTAKDFRGMDGSKLLKPDSWMLKTQQTHPLTILCLGQNNRGMLYAAYRLADIMATHEDIGHIDQFFEPKIGQRYVSFGATTYGRQVYQPAQYKKTLQELPRYGYNGVLIYPGGGTPLGRRASPVLETGDGHLYLDPANTRQWKNWFADLKRYDHDIVMTVPPVIPVGFSNAQIRGFYDGGPEPAGYVDSLKTHFRQYLSLLTATYPEVDAYLFNSTEGATFGRNERFFGEPGDNFPTQRYLDNNTKVMTAYFDVLSDFFKDRLDKVSFWTHSFGLTSQGIAKMREILFRYPRVTIVEDDYWNNNLWPQDLPSLNYLPESLRAKIHTQNPFGVFQIATDGEYYGGGSIPASYTAPHIRSAADALDRHAKMVIQRLDLHDRTPYGTLFGIMEIVPTVASAQLWSPTLSEDAVWKQWADRRFGPQAAPFVINALKTSKTILQKGLSANGADLLAVGSELNPRFWKIGSPLNHFVLFGKPGRLVVNKTSNDVITSAEYSKYQTKARTIAISDYLAQKQQAQQALAYGLSEIKKAKPYLQQADYDLLTGTFTNGKNVITALTLLGKLAYAANIVQDNYDHVANPPALFAGAVKDMKAFIAQKLLLPSMNNNLADITSNYEQQLSKQHKKLAD